MSRSPSTEPETTETFHWLEQGEISIASRRRANQTCSDSNLMSYVWNYSKLKKNVLGQQQRRVGGKKDGTKVNPDNRVSNGDSPACSEAPKRLLVTLTVWAYSQAGDAALGEKALKLHCREPSRNSDVLLHIRRASSASSSSSALPASTTDNGEEKRRHTPRKQTKRGRWSVRNFF